MVDDPETPTLTALAIALTAFGLGVVAEQTGVVVLIPIELLLTGLALLIVVRVWRAVRRAEGKRW